MDFKVMILSSGEYHNFNTPEFNLRMKWRVGEMLKVLKQGINIFNIDTDVALFEPESYFTQQMVSPMDILAQQEHDKTVCTGFMVVRSSDKMIDFFTKMYENIDAWHHDQLVLNNLLKTVKYDINVAFFSPQDVTSYGLISGGKNWNGESFDIPECNAFHANYTIGIENKRKLLAKAWETRKKVRNDK